MRRRLRYLGKRVVVVDRHIDRAVRREHQPLRPALGAAAVEIGLVIEAPAIRQRAGEIAELVAADHMARPERAQAAAMPAMPLRRLLRDIALRQMAGFTKALHGLDKSRHIAQPDLAGELGESLRTDAL